MQITKLLGINPFTATSKPLPRHIQDNNFVKNIFNFENANPNCPAAKVCNSPLGDPDRAVMLDLLA